MSPECYLLDTSALMALIEDEPGADRVEQIIFQGHAVLPWPVLLELYYMTRQEDGQAEADRRYALASKLKVQVVWRMDEQILLTAGRLKAEHGISFADALIAAFALREGATLVHKDPEYDALVDKVDMERLPYKVRQER
jgi:predicted nucleic acid-binding protein